MLEIMAKLSPEMLHALQAYREANGSNWRYKLSKAWSEDQDLGAELRRVHSIVGPYGLWKIKL